MSEKRQAAVMLFVNAQGELLLQLRDDKPDIRFPNHWGVIGGAVEAGESFEEALVREVAEEIEESAAEFISWKQRETPAGSSISIFAARLDKPAELITLHEGQRVEWVSPATAMTLPLVPWMAEELPVFVRSELYLSLFPEAAPPVSGIRRGEASARHEAAAVIFINDSGQVLLRLRSNLAGLPFAAMWDLIGGGMEEGETAEEAIVRETEEEIGVALHDHEYWGDIFGVVLIHVFAARLDVPAGSLVLTEGERVAWFAPEAAMELPLVPYMRTLIPRFAASPQYLALTGQS
jgi:8-oxo-dGTP diphosphatase